MLNCKALWVESLCLSQLMFTADLRAREYGWERECARTRRCHFPLRICVGVRVKLPATGGEMPEPVEARNRSDRPAVEVGTFSVCEQNKSAGSGSPRHLSPPLRNRV